MTTKDEANCLMHWNFDQNSWNWYFAVKVSKSRKQFMVSSILPNTERNLLSWVMKYNNNKKDTEFRLSFVRIEKTINCFRDLLSFRNVMNLIFLIWEHSSDLNKDIFSLTYISISLCLLLWAQDLPSSSSHQLKLHNIEILYNWLLQCVKMINKVVPDENSPKPHLYTYLLNKKSVILLKKNLRVFALKCPSTMHYLVTKGEFW